MITEILQFIFILVKRNFCWHKYKWVNGHDVVNNFQECEKCGHIRFF